MGPHATHAFYVLEKKWRMVTYDARSTVVHRLMYLCVSFGDNRYLLHGAVSTPTRCITHRWRELVSASHRVSSCHFRGTRPRIVAHCIFLVYVYSNVPPSSCKIVARDNKLARLVCDSPIWSTDGTMQQAFVISRSHTVSQMYHVLSLSWHRTSPCSSLVQGRRRRVWRVGPCGLTRTPHENRDTLLEP